MKQILTCLAIILCSLCSYAQFIVTPSGEIIDSLTRKDYIVIEREGSAAELYRDILKNVHAMFVNPDDVVSTIENEMISVTGYAHSTMKYALLNCSLEPLISVKIDFKDNRMRIKAAWVSVLWQHTTRTDAYTFLAGGGLKCFKKDGRVSNKGRFDKYNSVTQDFIDRILKDSDSVEDDW